MVVYHCNAVSDREIREQVRAGALDAADIATRCSAGARCGGCLEVVETLVAEGAALRARTVAA